MTTNRTRSFAAVAAIAVGVSLTACSQDAETTPTAATSAVTSTSTSSAAASTTEPVPTDSSDKTSAAGTESKLTVVDIRVGEHDGFDRVVYEMGGTGTPGWRVKYVDAATQEGSGKPVDIKGAAGDPGPDPTVPHIPSTAESSSTPAPTRSPASAES